MADADLELGEAVEHAASHHANGVGGDFDAVAPLSAVHAILPERHRHAVRRRARVEVDAAIEGLGGLEDGKILGIVEVLAVGVRVQDETVELQDLDRTLHLLGRAVGRLRSKRREAGEARGMTADDRGQAVVGELGKSGARVGVEHLDAGRGQR